MPQNRLLAVVADDKEVALVEVWVEDARENGFVVGEELRFSLQLILSFTQTLARHR